MKTVALKIPYGAGSVRFNVPKARLLGVLEHRHASPAAAGELISDAFARPAAKKALAGALAGKRRALIVVPDATRHAYVREILPRLLRPVRRAGGEATIIVATGLHKQHDRRELEALVGKDVVRKYRVIGHGLGRGDIASLGRTGSGVPITLDRNLFEHDVVLSIGVIEPHLYAGYSGGVKTVAIGLAGQPTIDETHGVRFLDHPLVGLGSIDRNPFQRALREIARKTRLAFSVNVVNDDRGRAARVFCGGTEDVFRRGVAYARKLYEVTARRQADIVICGVGRPKDINLYQASRAINYVVTVDRPVLRKGGVLIIAAELKDGAGTSPAEFLFYDMLKAMCSPSKFIARVKRHGCIAGEHRAYMVARPLLDYEIVFVSGRACTVLKGLPFKAFRTVSEAMRYAETVAGADASVYLIPRALSTIARKR